MKMENTVKRIDKNPAIIESKKVTAKKSSKAVNGGDGIKLVGDPDELIRLMITSLSKAKEAKNQISYEGSKHKQVLSALLFKRLYKMIRKLEKNCNTKFTLQKGSEIIVKKASKKTSLQVNFPIHLDEGLDSKKVVAIISRAAEHEVLVYAMCLQAIEWVIKLAGKK